MFPNKVVSIQNSILPVMVSEIQLIESGINNVHEIIDHLQKKYELDLIIYSFDVLFSLNRVQLVGGDYLNVVKN